MTSLNDDFTKRWWGILTFDRDDDRFKENPRVSPWKIYEDLRRSLWISSISWKRSFQLRESFSVSSNIYMYIYIYARLTGTHLCAEYVSFYIIYNYRDNFRDKPANLSFINEVTLTVDHFFSLFVIFFICYTEQNNLYDSHAFYCYFIFIYLFLHNI